jgi:hypothetical protein
MSFSFLPRWKFTDSCGRPQASGAIHVGCTHDGHRSTHSNSCWAMPSITYSTHP